MSHPDETWPVLIVRSPVVWFFFFFFIIIIIFFFFSL